MEILNNTKAKRRSQGIAFGIFRLLSLCIVLILFAILGFIIYKGIGVISWDFLTTAPTDGMTGGHLAGYRGYILPDGGQCAVCLSGGCDEWYLHERVCAEGQTGTLYPGDDQ